jgi:hypothetical protein
MLAFEYNTAKNCVEVYADEEGIKLLIKLLIKRLNALSRKDPGSYIAFGQGDQTKHHRENKLADYRSSAVKAPTS